MINTLIQQHKVFVVGNLEMMQLVMEFIIIKHILKYQYLELMMEYNIIGILDHFKVNLI